jgi:hypothetical protein
VLRGNLFASTSINYTLLTKITQVWFAPKYSEMNVIRKRIIRRRKNTLCLSIYRCCARQNPVFINSNILNTTSTNRSIVILTYCIVFIPLEFSVSHSFTLVFILFLFCSFRFSFLLCLQRTARAQQIPMLQILKVVFSSLKRNSHLSARKRKLILYFPANNVLFKRETNT